MIDDDKMQQMARWWHEPREISPRQRYRHALEAHAQRVSDEQFLLRGVERKLLLALWDGRGEFKYMPNLENPLWLEHEDYESYEDMDDEDTDEGTGGE